jgi:AraC-like DNA-binding protein
MNAGDAPPPVRLKAAMARPLLAMARANGVDVAVMLARARIAVDVGHDGSLITLAEYHRLQNEVSAALKDETLHLSKRQLLPGTRDFALGNLVGATSLYEAMRLLARTYNLLHGGEYNSVRRRGDMVCFVIDDRRFPYVVEDNADFIQFSVECVQIFLHCMLACVSRPHAQAGLRRVAVRRERRTADATHLDFWRAPVRFGAPVYELFYDHEAATARIEPPTADALSSMRVEAEIIAASGAPRGAGRGETADFVRQSLARGVIDQTRIAALAGVSVATLRRRLEAEGATFRDLRAEILNEAAKRLLTDRTPVAEVAEQLGFSDFRAFNRAFRAWNGLSPKAFSEASRDSAT